MTQLKVGLVCFPFIGLRIALYRASNLCPYECEPPALPNVLSEAHLYCCQPFRSTYVYQPFQYLYYLKKIFFWPLTFFAGTFDSRLEMFCRGGQL